ncbi:unnamed protein product, partial [Amoebophrya sp. A120]
QEKGGRKAAKGASTLKPQPGRLATKDRRGWAWKHLRDLLRHLQGGGLKSMPPVGVGLGLRGWRLPGGEMEKMWEAECCCTGSREGAATTLQPPENLDARRPS